MKLLGHLDAQVLASSKENAMRVYVNTFKNDRIAIKNLPLNKWFHVAVAVRQEIDIYISCNLKRHT